MIEIVKNGKACMDIISEGTPIALMATEELRKYLFLLSGCSIPVLEKSKGVRPSIFIGGKEWYMSRTSFHIDYDNLKNDGFCIKSVKNDLILTSNIERGILYAVYTLLEIIGCRWFYPGEYGEYIPSLQDICLRELSIAENPDFAIRGFTEGSHKIPSDIWKDEMPEMIDWCCKNRINSVFIAQEPGKELEGIDIIKSEIKKRGLLFEFGSHGVQDFIDRNLFEQKPYLFREKDGVRRKDGNFCGSDDEAIQMITNGVEKVIEKNPEIDILHLWYDDVSGGSWCECAKCINIPAPQQQISVINKISREVGKKYPHLGIDMLLYHDTLKLDEITDIPNDNVVGFFAPREKCYSHSIGDTSCQRNTIYFKNLTKAVSLFKNNTYVFEYYDDLILFKRMKMNIPDIITRDLKDYKNAGISKITSLMFGRYSWWAFEFNMLVFAKAAWNVDYDYKEGLKDYCMKLFPQTHQAVMDYYCMLEEASSLMLRFCDYLDEVLDLRYIPAYELDFQYKHLECINKSINIMSECIPILSRLIEKCSGYEKNRLIHQNLIMDISIREAKAYYNEIYGRCCYAKSGNSDKELLRFHLEKSIDYLKEIEELIVKIPYSIKGNTGGKSIYEDGLHTDMKICILKLESEEA